MTRNVDGRTTGYPDNMTDSEWTSHLAGWGPNLVRLATQPRQDNPGYPVYAAAVEVRERIYGPDRDGWPLQIHRPHPADVHELAPVPFATLIAAAAEAADPADAAILHAAFCIRPEPEEDRR